MVQGWLLAASVCPGGLDSSNPRDFLHSLSGKKRPEEKNRNNSGNVLFLLCVWVVGLCFDLIYLLPCSIWVASCQSRVVSRALVTQTFFFTFEFKIVHSAARIQIASENIGVELHHQKMVKNSSVEI